jgi:hypothetical protein
MDWSTSTVEVDTISGGRVDKRGRVFGIRESRVVVAGEEGKEWT